MSKAFIRLGCVAAAVTLSLAPLAAHAEPTVAISNPPACARPYVSAGVKDPMPPEIPAILAAAYFTGDREAAVQVDLSADGSVVNAAIARSAGSAILDNAALRSARLTSFSPEIRDCSAVAGSYLLAVDFGGR